MGIRMDQYIGLNHRAEDLVAGKRILLYTKHETQIYPDGKTEVLDSKDIYGSDIKREESEEFYEGMFGDKYLLNKYTFPDGRVYIEFVQAEPWSSGPMFFLALKDAETGEEIVESLWTEEEIDEELGGDRPEYEYI